MLSPYRGQWGAGWSSHSGVSPWPFTLLGLLLNSRYILGPGLLGIQPSQWLDPVQARYQLWEWLGRGGRHSVKDAQLEAKMASVFSRNRWARWVLFTVSWYLSLCSHISRNGYEFISVGRVKEHKIAQQCSVHVKVVEQRPTCLPALSSTSSVWNSLLEETLTQRRAHVVSLGLWDARKGGCF